MRSEIEMVLGSEFGTQSLGLQAPGGDWPGEGVRLQGAPEQGLSEARSHSSPHSRLLPAAAVVLSGACAPRHALGV